MHFTFCFDKLHVQVESGTGHGGVCVTEKLVSKGD